jgi:DNA replication protein DnaC
MSGRAVTLLTHLGLHAAATVLPTWRERAAREEVSYDDLITGVLEEEAAARASAETGRLDQAGFPFAASIEQFDFRFRPELKRQVVLRYLDPTYVEQARCLTLIGAPGLGKTMLAIAVVAKHVQLGASARFIAAQSLANQLGRAPTTLSCQWMLRPLLRCAVLVLDELGYLPTEPAFGPALYELIAGRSEQRPTISASNKSLTEWASIVPDVSLAAAVVDRIFHDRDVFYLKGPSWRVKDRPPDGTTSEGALAWWITLSPASGLLAPRRLQQVLESTCVRLGERTDLSVRIRSQCSDSPVGDPNLSVGRPSLAHADGEPSRMSAARRKTAPRSHHTRSPHPNEANPHTGDRPAGCCGNRTERAGRPALAQYAPTRRRRRMRAGYRRLL